MITADLEERLWPYLGGIARENKMRALTVGGVADHVHTPVVGTIDVGYCEGRATAQRQFLKVGSRNISTTRHV